MARFRDHGRRPRLLGRSVAAGVALAVAVLGLSATPAFAHNYVVGTTPAADAVVTEQPGTVAITTNDNLLDLSGEGAGSAIQVSGPTDAPRYYGDGCATVAGPTVSTEVQLGAAGEYTVVWQTVSTDGHPISDTFTFTWQPDATQELADGAADAPVCATAGGTGSAESDAATTDADATDSSDTASGTGADLLWIGGALVAVLAAIGVTLFLLRKRPAA
jgi:methionine-rich copper-binding protein CopC